MKKLLFVFLLLPLPALAQTRGVLADTPASIADRCLKGSISLRDYSFEKDGTLILFKVCNPQVVPTPAVSIETRIVWKEIYGVKEGKIVLIKEVLGKIVPAKVEWPYQ